MMFNRQILEKGKTINSLNFICNFVGPKVNKNKLTDGVQLTLATANTQFSNLNIFITNRLFGPAIEKAKRLALQDLRECVATTGIIQTRQFVPPEAWLEFIDSIFRVVWFCLYRDYLEYEGLNESMSFGKLSGITSKCVVPSRILDLAIHVLSPVIFKTEIFIPSPELVPCIQFENLSEIAPVFSVALGPCDPLALRYGVNLRVGMINVVKNLPGAMSSLTPFKVDEVFPVLRCILFRDKEMDDEGEEVPLVEFDYPEIESKIEVATIKDNRAIPMDVRDMSVPAYLERTARLNEHFFPLGLADYEAISDYAWFIPFAYSRIECEQNLANTLAVYLPLVVVTNDDLNSAGVRLQTLETDFGLAGTFRPSFMNSLRGDFVASCMQSIKSLRTKEGRLMPRFDTNDEVFGILRRMIVGGWKDLTFPSLDSQYVWTQPDWLLPSDSPFFPYQIRWTRQVRIELERVNKRKNVSKVRENVHEMKDSNNRERAPAADLNVTE